MGTIFKMSYEHNLNINFLLYHVFIVEIYWVGEKLASVTGLPSTRAKSNSSAKESKTSSSKGKQKPGPTILKSMHAYLFLIKSFFCINYLPSL